MLFYLQIGHHCYQALGVGGSYAASLVQNSLQLRLGNLIKVKLHKPIPESPWQHLECNVKHQHMHREVKSSGAMVWNKLCKSVMLQFLYQPHRSVLVGTGWQKQEPEVGLLCPGGYWVARTSTLRRAVIMLHFLPYDHHSVPVGTGWQKQDPEVSLHHVAVPYQQLHDSKNKTLR